MRVNVRHKICRHCFYASLLGREPSKGNWSHAPDDTFVSPVPPKRSKLVKYMLNSSLTKTRVEHPAETMSWTSGNKRSRYLGTSWVGGMYSSGWNNTRKFSCLSRLFNTARWNQPHMAKVSICIARLCQTACLLPWTWEFYWARPKQT